jgi:hypothetical protein
VGSRHGAADGSEGTAMGDNKSVRAVMLHDPDIPRMKRHDSYCTPHVLICFGWSFSQLSLFLCYSSSGDHVYSSSCHSSSFLPLILRCSSFYVWWRRRRELVGEVPRAGLIERRRYASQARGILLGHSLPYFVTGCNLALQESAWRKYGIMLRCLSTSLNEILQLCSCNSPFLNCWPCPITLVGFVWSDAAHRRFV